MHPHRLQGALFAFTAALLLLPALVLAADLTVSPAVIDEDAKTRDIIRQVVKVTNTTDHRLSVYPDVYNLEGGGGDRSKSLADWIEISRGVIDLEPGEARDISFVIRVHLNAPPGNYHAAIAFGEGSDHATAMSKPDIPKLNINVRVIDDSKEELQLLQFLTDKFFFSGDDVRFTYLLENIGDKGVSPAGDVRIYNRRGEEVATLPVNKDGKVIDPEAKELLAAVWNGADGMGQFKALLNVKYGGNQAAVYDTIFFWVVPWKLLAGVLAGGTLGMVLIALYLHGLLSRREAVPVLAGAGALPMPGVPHMPLPHAAHPAAVPAHAPPAPARRSAQSGWRRKIPSLIKIPLAALIVLSALLWAAIKYPFRFVRRFFPRKPVSFAHHEPIPIPDGFVVPGGAAPDSMPFEYAPATPPPATAIPAPVAFASTPPVAAPPKAAAHRPLAEVFAKVREDKQMVVNLKDAAAAEPVFRPTSGTFVVNLKGD